MTAQLPAAGLLDVQFFTSSLGLFSKQITLASGGYNSGGYNLNSCANPFGNITLTVLGNVVDQPSNVPEPGSFALGIAGLLALAALRRRATAAKLRH